LQTAALPPNLARAFGWYLHMRNAVLIGLAVIALVAGLFAVLHYRSWKSQPALSGLSPTQAAQHVGKGFVGTQNIGAWNLVCIKRPQLPAWAKASLKRPGMDLPPQPKSPHCTLRTRVSYPKDPARWIDIIYGRAGKARFFNIHMNVAAGYWSPGDYFGLRMDGRMANVRVLLCGRPFCAAVPMIKPKDIPTMKSTAGEQLASAKSAAFVFPAAAGKGSITVNIPMSGLREGAAALKRVDTPDL
jgi:hypothetical protein